MRRIVLVVVMLLVVAVGVVGARALLRDPIDDLVEPKRGDPPPAVVADDVPTVAEPSTASGPPPAAGRAWPFGEFEQDILDLRRADAPPEFEHTADLEAANVVRLGDHRFDITMKEAEFADVVDFLAAQMQPHGVAVYTREPLFKEAVTYTFDLRDVTTMEVVEQVYVQSRKRLKWHISELGVCIGSWAACEEDKRVRDLTVARRRATYDAQTPLLQVEYRPDFMNAHIGDVVRDIEQKTGVKVIVDREVWTNPTRITWRTGLRPLSVVTEELAKLMLAVVRVKDGRAFLITP